MEQKPRILKTEIPISPGQASLGLSIFRGGGIPEVIPPPEASGPVGPEAPVITDQAPRILRGAFFVPPDVAVDVPKPKLTRAEKRKQRLGKLIARSGAAEAARDAKVGYKVTGESGALAPPSKARLWHKDGRANGHAPPPGRSWDRHERARPKQQYQ